MPLSGGISAQSAAQVLTTTSGLRTGLLVTFVIFVCAVLGSVVACRLKQNNAMMMHKLQEAPPPMILDHYVKGGSENLSHLNQPPRDLVQPMQNVGLGQSGRKSLLTGSGRARIGDTALIAADGDMAAAI